MDRRDWFQRMLVAGGATCIAMPRKMPKTTVASYEEAWRRMYYPGCYMTIEEWRAKLKRDNP